MSPGVSPTMISADFDLVVALLKRNAGIVIGADKAYLVETRLAPIVRARGLTGLPDLIERVRRGDPTLRKIVVEAMTTNETLFFRDRTPFEAFKRVMLPHLMEKRARGGAIRIWCAACATGQEPYSLAMILDELGALTKSWRFEILATDLSDQVLEKARDGLYTQFEVQRGLPVSQLLRYFGQEGQNWRLDARIREKVVFRQLNLLQDFGALGPFDIILCRNLLIYFDEETKRRLLDRLAATLAPDGFFMLGAAETPFGFSTRFARHPEEQHLLVRADHVDAFRARPVRVA